MKCLFDNKELYDQHKSKVIYDDTKYYDDEDYAVMNYSQNYEDGNRYCYFSNSLKVSESVETNKPDRMTVTTLTQVNDIYVCMNKNS